MVVFAFNRSIRRSFWQGTRQRCAGSNDGRSYAGPPWSPDNLRISWRERDQWLHMDQRGDDTDHFRSRCNY
jgi:hypothetical protein